MIRVLHVLHSMNRGGAEAMLMNYYRNIDRELVQFDFLLTEQSHCQYEDEIVSMGGKVFRVPLLTFNPIPYIIGVYAFLKSHPEYKIIHSHTSSKSAVPLTIAKFCGIPVRICHSHNNKSERGLLGLVRDSLKYPLRKVSTDFFSCGYSASVWLYGKKIVNSNSVYGLKNAINVDLFAYSAKSSKEIRNRFSILEGTMILGMVARFSHQKNHLFALDVLKALIDLRQDVVLMLVGDGELKTEIIRKASRLGLLDRLVMVGVVADVYHYLSAMDVVLMPSFSEGLPVSIIEAQASGLRCILSSEVSPEVDVTGNITFLHLEINRWVNAICQMSRGWRDPNAREKIRKSGYEIKNAAKSLQNWYLDKFQAL